MSRALVEGLFRTGARVGETEGAATLRSSSRSIVDDILRDTGGAVRGSANDAGRQITDTAISRATRSGAAQTTRAVEDGERDALSSSMRKAEQTSAKGITINATPSAKAAGMTAAGTVGVAVVGVGGAALAHETLKNDIKEATTAVNSAARNATTALAQVGRQTADTMAQAGHETYDTAGNNLLSLHDGAASALDSTFEKAGEMLHTLPNSTQIGSRVTALGNLTSNVSTILVIGIGVFAAYEVWRFSRAVRS